MKKRAKDLVSVICLALLAACECQEECKISEGVSVTEDEALRGTAADFIANAGDRIFFDFDKSSISPEGEATLSRQADWLNGHTGRKVLIEGHCDDRGTREYNLGLGERRAEAAAKFLTEHGVDADRVRTISYGKDRPIAGSGSKDDIYRMNRVAVSVIE